MRWVDIYEEYKRVIHDYLVVKHIYRRAGSMRFYICQFSLQSDLNRLGPGLARKYYLVKTYSQYEKSPAVLTLRAVTWSSATTTGIASTKLSARQDST